MRGPRNGAGISASRRQTTAERVAIIADVQAVTIRMASEEPVPGQKYVLLIAALQKARADMAIQTWWCPALTGNQLADQSATIAAEDPDAHGVQWLSYLNGAEARAMPLQRSLAHVKREIMLELSLAAQARDAAVGLMWHSSLDAAEATSKSWTPSVRSWATMPPG